MDIVETAFLVDTELVLVGWSDQVKETTEGLEKDGEQLRPEGERVGTEGIFGSGGQEYLEPGRDCHLPGHIEVGHGEDAKVHVAEPPLVHIVNTVVVEVGLERGRAQSRPELPLTARERDPELEGGEVLPPVPGGVQPLELIV